MRGIHFELLNPFLCVVFLLFFSTIAILPTSSISIIIPPDEERNVHSIVHRISSSSSSLRENIFASEFEFPFIAAFINEHDGTTRCMGALIHPFYIITVESCEVPNGSRVIIGQSDLSQPVDILGMSVDVVVESSKTVGEDQGIRLVRLRYPTHVRPIQIRILTSSLIRDEDIWTISYGTGLLLRRSLVSFSDNACLCLKDRLNDDSFESIPINTRPSSENQSVTIPSNIDCLFSTLDSNLGAPLVTIDETTGNMLLIGLVVDKLSYSSSGIFYKRFTSKMTKSMTDHIIGQNTASSGKTETRFTYSDPALWSSIKAPNNDARANRWCQGRKYTGGFQMRQLGVDHGVMCFSKSLAKLMYTVNIKSQGAGGLMGAEFRKQTAIWSRTKKTCASGVWTGDHKLQKKKRKFEVLCIAANHHNKQGSDSNVILVQVMKTDLFLDQYLPKELEFYDLAGLLFARKYGFQAGIWTGEESADWVEFAMIGSSYEWSYESFVVKQVTSGGEGMEESESECVSLQERCSLGVSIVKDQSTFNDGWSAGYPAGARKCFIIPSRDANSITTIRFNVLDLQQGDSIQVFNIIDQNNLNNNNNETNHNSNKAFRTSPSLPVWQMEGPVGSSTTFQASFPGQVLLIEFSTSIEGSDSNGGFDASIVYQMPREECSPLLSMKLCKQLKCAWIQGTCLPPGAPTKRPTRKPTKKPTQAKKKSG